MIVLENIIEFNVKEKLLSGNLTWSAPIKFFCYHLFYLWSMRFIEKGSLQCLFAEIRIPLVREAEWKIPLHYSCNQFKSHSWIGINRKSVIYFILEFCSPAHPTLRIWIMSRTYLKKNAVDRRSFVQYWY